MAAQHVDEQDLEQRLADGSDDERAPSSTGARTRTGLLAVAAVLATAGFAAFTLGGAPAAAKSAFPKEHALQAYNPLANNQGIYDVVPPTGDAYHATPIVAGAAQLPPACKYTIGDNVLVQGVNGGWNQATVAEVQAGCNYRVQFTDGVQSMYSTSQVHQDNWWSHNWWSHNWWWVTLLLSIALLAAIFVALKK
mmetsp:Transcript_44168/g.127545  ORF Transcript_44168/g.127545 Transcript_44168/m.127545 type:complete len:194 (-) Transcript_44168:107-688(-)|eukprot:CAMPEP_0176018384 /NCGR_PEP_ID=MMETSP0120_2-20121206/8850_1 /TAXON_ID=160619 /ORGANISM="Kryptoperidinium foliaceum, Strain CCMP 1326" /LENGTH=193 /DNA_ID=CAMNT_0017351433 /DNA_START=29 /DNA_END=610 /DNA_ORIENTATION=+